MATEKVLPEGVMCKLCAGGRLFHHLAGHLTHVHGTNQAEYRKDFGISPTEPLFSRQYSKSRSKVASRPPDVGRAKLLIGDFTVLRIRTIAALRAKGLFTTGQVTELTGLCNTTIRNAVRKGKLPAGIACLITFAPDKDNVYHSIRLPGPPQAIMTIGDLLLFTETQPMEVQQRTIKNLPTLPK